MTENNDGIKRIAVMTSGGDAPGMNAALRAVVRTALAYQLDVFGIHQAYYGLLHDRLERLGARDVGGIIQKGGTVLQTARLPEFSQVEVQKEALANLRKHEIDALVVIGGDGSLRGAHALHLLGMPVVGVPASIDNDIWGTNMAIGVDTAINTILDAIDKVRDTASSHQRTFLIETMGRDNGYLALMAGISGGAEVTLIPEHPVTLEEVQRRVQHAYVRGKSHAIIINAEGSGIKSEDIVHYLKDHNFGYDIRMTILGHVQRGGSPSGFDRLLATRLGHGAVECLVNGQTDVMVGLDGRRIRAVPIDDVINNERSANLQYYALIELLAR
ncbi:MAG: 6-phosphofructokinase [Anaerolineales bacterium]|nr:6-phosphofructokinase [Anaerolineales bacterium]MCB9128178.1 6-phosphofructokinase [Ardenticatenales bacterium]MCB9171887.1 6-phosphofructokinase [Ardenticatenales bacterium]